MADNKNNENSRKEEKKGESPPKNNPFEAYKPFAGGQLNSNRFHTLYPDRDYPPHHPLSPTPVLNEMKEVQAEKENKMKVTMN